MVVTIYSLENIARKIQFCNRDLLVHRCVRYTLYLASRQSSAEYMALFISRPDSGIRKCDSKYLLPYAEQSLSRYLWYLCFSITFERDSPPLCDNPPPQPLTSGNTPAATAHSASPHYTPALTATREYSKHTLSKP